MIYVKKNSYLCTIAVILLIGLFQTPSVRAVPLAGDDVVIIVKSGINSDGTFRYEVADSSDNQASKIWDIATSEMAMSQVLDYYKDIQTTDVSTALSREEQEILNYYSSTPKDPVYIEIKEGSSGAYCDWKGNFTLTTPSGAVVKKLTPKVVLNRNDPLFTGSDRALQTQTLVHEIGHGAMSKLYGYDNLPYTEWLHKSHSGGTVSDEKLAIIEGWAEFIGAYYTRDYTIANDPDNSMTDNRYAYKDIYTRTTPRSAQELLKTEGWVASALLSLVNSQTVSMAELTNVMKASGPHTFEDLIDELSDFRPDKEGAIKAVIAEASLGQIYPRYYSTTDYLANGSDGINTGSFNVSFTETDSNDTSRLFATISGALLGALAGSPFGIVGMAIGAAAGLAAGLIISESFASEGYVATPAVPVSTNDVEISTGSPAAATDGHNNEPDSNKQNQLNISELRAHVDEAFKCYLDAVHRGTIEEQKLTLNNYKSLHNKYRQLLMKDETAEK